MEKGIRIMSQILEPHKHSFFHFAALCRFEYRLQFFVKLLFQPFNRGGENSLLYRTQKTAALLTEFSFPNVTMPLSFVPQTTTFSRAGWGHSSVEIKPFMGHGACLTCPEICSFSFHRLAVMTVSFVRNTSLSQ